MKVLITGNCGYVGSELTSYLIGAGHVVVGYDIGWFGNIGQPQETDWFHQVTADIRDVIK